MGSGRAGSSESVLPEGMEEPSREYVLEFALTAIPDLPETKDTPAQTTRIRTTAQKNSFIIIFFLVMDEPPLNRNFYNK